jgi:hypothetical protein
LHRGARGTVDLPFSRARATWLIDVPIAQAESVKTSDRARPLLEAALELIG